MCFCSELFISPGMIESGGENVFCWKEETAGTLRSWGDVAVVTHWREAGW